MTRPKPRPFAPQSEPADWRLRSWTPEEREEYEERAAIMEYDGRMTRPEAGARAFEVVGARRRR